jgi:stage III sporulation protein AE
MIVTLIMNNFANILSIVKETIQNLVGFSNNLIPLLITLMLATGNITSAGVIQPVLMFIITFIGNMISSVLLPILLIATALSIISKMSDKVQVDKISKFLKSSIAWILGVALTLFVGVLSLEGSLTSGVDGITAKTAKAAVSSLVPVVGKILGDAVDTVIGCSNILKNAVGLVGVVVILCICIIPILKLTILSFTYKLTSALCQPIADKNVVELLEQIGDTFKILLAMMVSISVMLMIGITLVIKITNSSLMYR